VDAADPTAGIGLTAANFPVYALLRVEMPSRSLYELRAGFAGLADLTDATNLGLLDAGGFQAEHFYQDDHGDCPLVARVGESLGWEAILAPSAALRPSGQCLAILPAGSSKIETPRLLFQYARPTVAVAAATTYRDSQRAPWLPG